MPALRAHLPAQWQAPQLSEFSIIADDGYVLPVIGHRVPVHRFPQLFAVLGYTYRGSGDTFGLPDVRASLT